MSRRAALAGGVIVLALWAWRSQLFTVSRPGDAPRALSVRAESLRVSSHVDAVLPSVPAGMTHLKPGEGVLLIHYWAPWERHSAVQAALLDSLRRSAPLQSLRVVVVCLDPYPSVARFVARHRLRLSVLLDTERHLRAFLPCPSVPFTYVLDRAGRVAVAQPGEVDWFAAETRSGLTRLLEEDLRELPRSAKPLPPT